MKNNLYRKINVHNTNENQGTVKMFSEWMPWKDWFERLVNWWMWTDVIGLTKNSTFYFLSFVFCIEVVSPLTESTNDYIINYITIWLVL